MKNRVIRNQIVKKLQKKTGRLIVITGARQTGKTTLVKSLSDTYSYISLEDPVLRDDWQELTAAEWHHRYPNAVLDEIQKTPSLVESVKAVYDQYPDARYILLGSIRILLMKKVRESLAGRASIYELYPLTLPEQRCEGWDSEIEPSLFIKILQGKIKFEDILNYRPLLDERLAEEQSAWDSYLQYGLMPVICDQDLDREEKLEWLKNYTITYLQRDVADIARINDLEPFTRVLKQCALLTAQTVNMSQLAAYSSIAVNTVKKFLSYLELSYQTFILQPWSRNDLKRMVKSPKIHVLDPGICRSLTGHLNDMSGHEFESAVVGEIYKQVKAWQIPSEMYHLRTVDGREIDLLVEMESGYYAFEIKMTKQVRKSDFRHLKGLNDILDKPLLGGFILSQDRKIQHASDSLAAVPAFWFLG